MFLSVLLYEYSFCTHNESCLFHLLHADARFLIHTPISLGRILLYAGVVIGVCLILAKRRGSFPRWVDILFSLAVSGYLYKIWPHTFFDDAGFIMRYLDQLKHGFWFQYNPGEGAVFGISGFMHGLYCSILVKYFGMSAERALHVSNLLGLFFTVYFLSGIFRYLFHKPAWAYVATFIVVSFSKSWCDVLFTGMETPLHVAFIVGSLYFLITQRYKLFYFMGALSVVSKLDAVPVIAILFLMLALHQIKEVGFLNAWKKEWRSFIVYFGVPLICWVLFSYSFFGSPFPQSAKAKVLYHSGANDSFFPFLEGFTNDVYKYPLLILFGLFFLVHVLYSFKKGLQSVTYYFSFGWMFIAIMALYFFYNPNERMLWYYALPDFLLVAQCLLSSVWLAMEAKDWKRFALPPVLFVLWIIYLKPDVDGGRNWMFSYLEKVEKERYEMGKYIAKVAKNKDKLLAWHGLIARPFPGFVLDGTGLNSKMAVDFKLNRDSMLAVVKPTYGVHHAYPWVNESFSNQGYFIKGMFADVTLENWPAWIWWEKRTDESLRSRVQLMNDSMLLSGKITHDEYPLKVEGKSVIFNLPIDASFGVFWAAMEGRGSDEKSVLVRIKKEDGAILEERFVSLPAYGDTTYPSLYTLGVSIPFSRTHSDSTYQMNIEFLPTGADTLVKINNALVEYPY